VGSFTSGRHPGKVIIGVTHTAVTQLAGRIFIPWAGDAINIQFGKRVFPFLLADHRHPQRNIDLIQYPDIQVGVEQV
jgi:hypothetical protein